MLLLTRREGQQIVVGDNITITLVEIDEVRGRVRLGIDAPREVPIRRPEIAERICTNTDNPEKTHG